MNQGVLLVIIIVTNFIGVWSTFMIVTELTKMLIEKMTHNDD